MYTKLRIYVTARPITGHDTPEDVDHSWYVDRGGVRYELNYFEPDAEDEACVHAEHFLNVTPKLREEFIPAAIKALDQRIGRKELEHYAEVQAIKARIGELSALTHQPEEE